MSSKPRDGALSAQDNYDEAHYRQRAAGFIKLRESCREFRARRGRRLASYGRRGLRGGTTRTVESRGGVTAVGRGADGGKGAKLRRGKRVAARRRAKRWHAGYYLIPLGQVHPLVAGVISARPQRLLQLWLGVISRPATREITPSNSRRVMTPRGHVATVHREPEPTVGYCASGSSRVVPLWLGVISGCPSPRRRHKSRWISRRRSFTRFLRAM